MCRGMPTSVVAANWHMFLKTEPRWKGEPRDGCGKVQAHDAPTIAERERRSAAARCCLHLAYEPGEVFRGVVLVRLLARPKARAEEINARRPSRRRASRSCDAVRCALEGGPLVVGDAALAPLARAP